MRELAVAGFVAVAFGLVSLHATERVGAFVIANFCLGGAALLAAIALFARRLGTIGSPHSRRAIGFGLLRVIGPLDLRPRQSRIMQPRRSRLVLFP